MLMRKVRHFRIHMMEAQSAASCILQPALPAWGATVFRLPADYAGHVSIHTPVWGATRNKRKLDISKMISIHTPRMGSDHQHHPLCLTYNDFNPHSPYGERHKRLNSTQLICAISIHTPRMGSDPADVITAVSGVNFNPHSPYGERQASVDFLKYARVFQSTLPVWGVTRMS